MNVYLLQHTVAEGTPNEDSKIVGMYSSREKAVAATARMVVLPGFRSAPDGFTVDEYVLDADHWTDGFGLD